MKKYFDLVSLSLGNSGMVAGAEAALEVLSDHDIELISGAGFDENSTDSTNGRCANLSNCAGTTNTSCNNIGANCSGSTNDSRCKFTIAN